MSSYADSSDFCRPRPCAWRWWEVSMQSFSPRWRWSEICNSFGGTVQSQPMAHGSPESGAECCGVQCNTAFQNFTIIIHFDLYSDHWVIEYRTIGSWVIERKGFKADWNADARKPLLKFSNQIKIEIEIDFFVVRQLTRPLTIDHWHLFTVRAGVVCALTVGCGCWSLLVIIICVFVLLLLLLLFLIFDFYSEFYFTNTNESNDSLTISSSYLARTLVTFEPSCSLSTPSVESCSLWR